MNLRPNCNLVWTHKFSCQTRKLIIIYVFQGFRWRWWWREIPESCSSCKRNERGLSVRRNGRRRRYWGGGRRQIGGHDEQRLWIRRQSSWKLFLKRTRKKPTHSTLLRLFVFFFSPRRSFVIIVFWPFSRFASDVLLWRPIFFRCLFSTISSSSLIFFWLS